MQQRGWWRRGTPPSSFSHFPIDSLFVREAAYFGGSLRPWAGPKLGARCLQPLLGRRWPGPAFLAGLWGRTRSSSVVRRTRSMPPKTTIMRLSPPRPLLGCGVLCWHGWRRTPPPRLLGTLLFDVAAIPVNPDSGLIIDSYWNGGVAG